MEMKEITINKRTYNIVDQYVYGNRAISILERNGQYFVDNYEGMGLFIGPFAEAIKTGDNGEVLVKDFKKDYYYVPAIKGQKPDGIGFLKEYHPEYHYAQPYFYYNGYGNAIAIMEDGSYRLKSSSGTISSEAYKAYRQFDYTINPDIIKKVNPNSNSGQLIHYHIDYFQTAEDRHFVRTLDLELPLRAAVSKNAETYCREDDLAFSAISTYLNYSLGQVDLESLPHIYFQLDEFVKAVLRTEKLRYKEIIEKRFDKAYKNLEEVAKTEPNNIRLIQVDEYEIKSELENISRIITEKRMTAMAEIAQETKLREQECKARVKVDDVLNFGSIIKKSNSRRKKTPPTEMGSNG